MAFALLADFVVVAHLLFILFVVAGGFLALRNLKWAWLHVPAAVWGALVECSGWICPLTPLENRLRRLGGGPVYSSDFVERYIVPDLPGGTDPQRAGLTWTGRTRDQRRDLRLAGGPDVEVPGEGWGREVALKK